jgi:hypothetical protein
MSALPPKADIRLMVISDILYPDLKVPNHLNPSYALPILSLRDHCQPEP